MGKSQLQTSPDNKRHLSGITSGLLSAFMLGWAPILGKFAYQARVNPMTLAALRSVVAAAFLWIMYLIFWRKRISLPLHAAFACMLVGVINGFASIFYYNGLVRLDASRASLLGALYPVWVVIFLSASGQPITLLTLSRLIVSLIGAVLVTASASLLNATDFLGAMLMIASAAINGWYMVMGQWVLSDVPSQSGTLYIITGMALTVAMARVMTGEMLAPISVSGWAAIVALGLTTGLSRMAMFFSLEKLGGVQTAIISLMELAVSLTLAFIFLGDRLTLVQWIGAILLLGGGIFARLDVERGAAPPPSFNPMEH